MFIRSLIFGLSPNTDVNIDGLRVNKNQILVTCSGTIGKTSIVSKTLDGQLFSHDLLRISALNEYDTGYLYAFLRSEIGQTLLKTNNYGAVISHIEPEHLKEIPIPNPSPIIKAEINGLIANSFALRDESNEMFDEAEQLLIKELDLPQIEQLKPHYFDSEAECKNFTVRLSEAAGRLEPTYHKPLVRTIQNKIRKTAGEVLSVSNDRISKNIVAPGRFKRVYVGAGEGVAFFGGKELLQLDPTGEKFLSLTHHSHRIKDELTLRENMIMVTCSGTVGKVALVPQHWDGWTANQHILRIVPANPDIAGYLYAWLATPYGKELIRRFIYGAVVDEIDSRHLSQVEIPILKNRAIQRKINSLVLDANKKRSEAFRLERKAIIQLNQKVIYS
jgi:type I restriction enzyme, S subunit